MPHHSPDNRSAGAESSDILADTPADPLALALTGKMPEPARRPGHAHWTRAKMVTFLRELAATHSVQQAAQAVGMNRSSAYRMRSRMVGTPFDLGWEVALEMGMRNLAHAVMDRAINGEEVEHYYHGELVGTTRRFDNRLAIWMLDNPWKIGRHQMAREYSAEAFEMLLERIESASLDWEAGEDLPNILEPAPSELDADGEFLAEDGEEKFRKKIARDQDDFVGRRSWYSALAEADARGGGRYGRR